MCDKRTLKIENCIRFRKPGDIRTKDFRGKGHTRANCLKYY